MDERICKEDIRDFMRREYGMSEQEASDALDKFFKVLVDALENERYVKVKGLGIFKLIDVESRKSVDVNTGESIEIPSHRRISYSVDSNLKEMINKPFAHFETVELRENALHHEGEGKNMQEEDSEVALCLEESKSQCEENVYCRIEIEEQSMAHENTACSSDELNVEEENKAEVCPKTDNGSRLHPVRKREDIQRMELMLEKEELKNRIALIVVVVLMAVVVLGGLIFMLAPEWIEEWLLI